MIKTVQCGAPSFGWSSLKTTKMMLRQDILKAITVGARGDLKNIKVHALVKVSVKKDSLNEPFSSIEVNTFGQCEGQEEYRQPEVTISFYGGTFEWEGTFPELLKALLPSISKPNEKPPQDREKILTGWEKNKFKTDNVNSLDLKAMQTLCAGSGLETTMDYFKRLYFFHETGKFIRAQSGFAKMPERFQTVFLKWLKIQVGTTEADIYNFFLKTNNHDN